MEIKGLGLCVVVCVLTCYVVRRWRVRTWGTCRSKKCMSGKTVIITGANSGLGKATAEELAQRGAKVILACRDISGGLAAATEIRSKSSTDNVIVRYLDLSSFASIRTFVNNILKSEMHIEALVNNAAVFQCPYATTKEGFELQMGVNHLGHFLLTNLLLERLKNSPPSRIVVVTSHLYRKGNIKATDLLMKERDYDKKKAYVNSKLANVLFARELSRRLKGTGVRVYTVSPGMVYTNLGRHCKLPWYFVLLLLPFALFAVRTPKQGCQSIVDCVLNEDYDQHSGRYYRNCKAEKWDPIALDDDLALKVWTASQSLTGLLSAEG